MQMKETQVGKESLLICGGGCVCVCVFVYILVSQGKKERGLDVQTSWPHFSYSGFVSAVFSFSIIYHFITTNIQNSKLLNSYPQHY